MQEYPPTPSDDFVHAVTGNDVPVDPDMFHAIHIELNAGRQRELNNAAQIQELFLIKTSADRIEDEFKRKNLPLPTVFTYYTAGFTAPLDATPIAAYGQGPLEHFQPADIGGHLGLASALRLDAKHSAMLFMGRAHPYAGVGQKFAELTYARPFNVIKELMRRQRENGKQSVAIFTYLTGVDETSPLTPGDLGIIIDHTELAGGRAGLSAGAGPRNILDSFIGERFQPKLNRASDSKLAKQFYDIAAKKGIHVGTATAIGTPGTTSYQSHIDRGLALSAFNTVKDDLNAMTQQIVIGAQPVSLFYDMALSFEIDVIRQTIARNDTDGKNHYVEQDFPALFLALPTDIVGSGSADVDHAAVVVEAFRHGDRNGKAIRMFMERAASSVDAMHPLHQLPQWVHPSFSLSGLLPQE
jgi:hypothetical protein